MTLKEIALIGGGTFAVVGAIAFLLFPKNAAEAGTSSALAGASPSSAPVQVLPGPVELGSPPPDGVELDSEYRRRQLTAFLSDRAGETVEVVDAVEIPGSQRTEYCEQPEPLRADPLGPGRLCFGRTLPSSTPSPMNPLIAQTV